MKRLITKVYTYNYNILNLNFNFKKIYFKKLKIDFRTLNFK